MSFLYYTLLTIFLVLSLFLILLVLIQKGRGGGLSAAFGGVGGNTAFGAKTGDVLTWATSAIFGLFLVLAIGLNLIANRVHAAATRLDVDAPATQPTAMATPTTVPADRSAGSVDTLPAPPSDPAINPPVMPAPSTKPATKPTSSSPGVVAPTTVAPQGVAPTTKLSQ